MTIESILNAECTRLGLEVPVAGTVRQKPVEAIEALELAPNEIRTPGSCNGSLAYAYLHNGVPLIAFNAVCETLPAYTQRLIVLHELAHLYCHNSPEESLACGHGPVWKRCVSRFGGQPMSHIRVDYSL